MMDWSDLVLAPAQVVFGRPITVTPVASQPNAPAYSATGIYSLKPVQILLQDTQTYHQTFQATLGIRLSDFEVAPAQDDMIVMSQGTFVIENLELDGQGKADLILRQTS